MKKDPRTWVWVPPVEQEVEEELAFHLEMHTRDLIANGMPPDAAREAARQRLGDIHRLQRTCVSLGRKRDRTMRITQWLDDCRDDLIVAVRRLKQSPGFTAVAVLTLALGIGANSAIFALADAALLRPLHFPEPDRLMRLYERTPTTERNVVAPFEVAAWSDRSRTFQAIAGFWPTRRAMTGADGTGEQIDVQTVSIRFFDVFRVAPLAGRTFIAADDRPGADAVIVSERLWKGRFGGDPGLLDRQVKFDGDQFRVVGIMPDGFQVLSPSDAWFITPTSFMRSPAGVAHFLRVAGRLAPRTPLADARREMSTIADAIGRERPEMNKDRGVLVETLHDGLIDPDLQLTAKLLLGVVAFVLLTCCANVANLMLARTSTRARELAVRSALGAGGRRIARLLFTESLVLAGLAAVLGAALGAAILDAAPSFMPPRVLPVDVRLTFDERVLAFCAVAAFMLALAFSAVPAWQASHLPPVQAMTTGGRTSTRSGSWFRSVLAMSQIAAAVVLLCGAGLLLRSLFALGQVDSGSRASEVLTMTISLPFVRSNPPPGMRYVTPDSQLQFYEAVEREVRSVAGVRDVAFGSALPLEGWWIGMFFQLEDAPPRPEAMRDQSRYQHVGPSYFNTLGVPLVAGRAFTSADTAGSPPVCIVNEALARKYLKGRSPVGARIIVRGMNTGAAPLPVREIVGVVSNVKERPDETDAQPQIYVPFAQDTPSQLSLAVAPAGGSAAMLAPAVRAAIARVDRERPVQDVKTIAGIRREATSPARFRSVLVGAFALLAMTLSLVGVFGVLAYSVQQRVREFGVRVALGATTTNVLAIVFGSTARIVGVGVVAGLLAAAALGRSMSAFLFGVQPIDPLTFASVATLLASTAMLAATIPAVRAARVDPIVALRDE
jgi:putative ABC transport system permease protein